MTALLPPHSDGALISGHSTPLFAKRPQQPGWLGERRCQISWLALRLKRVPPVAGPSGRASVWRCQSSTVTRARSKRAALVERVRAEVADALISYRTAAAESELLESTVLAPAGENRRLLETAYREGKFGLPVLLLVRNQTIDAEIEYVNAWLAEHEARAALDQSVGALVPRDVTATTQVQRIPP